MRASGKSEVNASLKSDLNVITQSTVFNNTSVARKKYISLADKHSEVDTLVLRAR